MINVIKKADSIVSALLLAAMVLLVLLQIYMRYISDGALAWSEEMVSWTFLWMSWLGISSVYSSNDNGHISVGYKGIKGERSHQLMTLISNIAQILFFSILIYYTIELVQKPYIFKQSSVVLSLPIWLLYLSVIIGSSLSVMKLIYKTTRCINEIMRFSK